MRRVARSGQARRGSVGSLAAAVRRGRSARRAPNSRAASTANCRTAGAARSMRSRRSSPRDAPKIATRQASGKVLDALAPVLPELIGGSADLTGSNNTKAKSQKIIAPGRFLRQLHPLRRARARHGGGDERHGRAWRHHSLWRHLSRLHRLLPARDPALGADAVAGHLCDDARFDRAWRGRADASADRASGEPARHSRPAACSVRPMRSKPRNAGNWRWRSGRAPSVLALTRQALPALRKDGGENRSARGAYVIAGRRASATSRCSRPAPRSRWRSRRANCSPRAASGPRSCRCRAGNCSTPRRGLSRRGAGRRAAGCGRGGLSFRLGALCRGSPPCRRHDAASAHRLRQRRCSTISASRPRAWPTWPMR